MKTNGWQYSVSGVIILTGTELNVLQACSRRHYDYECRTACEQGGFLYGMFNDFLCQNEDFDARADVPTLHLDKEGKFTLPTHELDILCKILEVSDNSTDFVADPLAQALLGVLRAANTEWQRINGTNVQGNECPCSCCESQRKAKQSKGQGVQGVPE